MRESNRRTRTDSAEFKQKLFDDILAGAPEAPEGVEISSEVMPFWVTVTMSKAKRAWTESDLVTAAELARCMYRLEVISRQIESQLSLIADPELADNVFKMERVADTIAKRVKLLATHLQVHPEATQGKSHKQVAQNLEHKNTKQVINGDAQSLDSLIPGMNPQ